MTKLKLHQGGLSPRTCVIGSESLSTTDKSASFVGKNVHHEQHLVELLMDIYGWAVGVDGELLPPKSWLLSNKESLG